MKVFFDSSAFVKRFVAEDGSETVIAWCDKASEIGLAGIALPEIISAFCRLRREKRITQDEYGILKAALHADIEDAQICDLGPTVVETAIASLETNILRGMDAIHIGSAIALRVDVFVSADDRQCEAARRAGLSVVAV